jgi:hypothetical protein
MSDVIESDEFIMLTTSSTILSNGAASIRHCLRFLNYFSKGSFKPSYAWIISKVSLVNF